jgi:putative DNA primase/helicase
MGGDDALIKYIQRAVGYSLTGHTSEQCLFFLYGTGANGKSTFLNILQNLLGDYSMVIDPETIMSKNGGGGATPELARLRGARVLVTNEVEEGKYLAENRIKQMTGGDTIVARALYQEPFEFKPEFKIWMAGNHKPLIKGTDHAIWRRINLIPFTVTIPKEEQDKKLAEKLRAELPGILQWAVAGCREWRKQGLNPPKQVKAAVDAYRDEMDTLGHWIEEKCRFDTSFKTESSSLYQSYKSWCMINGHSPQSKTRFGRALGDRGLFKEKQGTVSWIGIGLKGLDSLDSCKRFS